ncbi:hypothetical protein E2636_11680 [Paenisporosarcina antarctica]|uniref:Uncharacterized protein n=1 Tax=Paenisporosarcina antarctica TaxID=417367 RepID=A0A4P7A1I9_9BACL|nr:hypothetical protein E2636_11680 [Paenisporosarcina antarctica]
MLDWTSVALYFAYLGWAEGNSYSIYMLHPLRLNKNNWRTKILCSCYIIRGKNPES